MSEFALPYVRRCKLHERQAIDKSMVAKFLITPEILNMFLGDPIVIIIWAGLVDMVK